jgi:hypothetical protein
VNAGLGRLSLGDNGRRLQLQGHVLCIVYLILDTPKREWTDAVGSCGDCSGKWEEARGMSGWQQMEKAGIVDVKRA